MTVLFENELVCAICEWEALIVDKHELFKWQRNVSFSEEMLICEQDASIGEKNAYVREQTASISEAMLMFVDKTLSSAKKRSYS